MLRKIQYDTRLKKELGFDDVSRSPNVDKEKRFALAHILYASEAHDNDLLKLEILPLQQTRCSCGF